MVARTSECLGQHPPLTDNVPPPHSEHLSPLLNGIVSRARELQPIIDTATQHIRSINELGRLVMVKWQNRMVGRNEQGLFEKHPVLRRTATFLGSVAAVSTVTTLLSRGTQAYAMTRHGINLGVDTPHAAIDVHHGTYTDALPAATHLTNVHDQIETPTKQEPMVLASAHSSSLKDGVPSGDHVYGGIRIEGEDFAGRYRTAEPWSTDRDSAWDWGQQELAVAARKAGYNDQQISAVAHDRQAISHVMNSLIESNRSIKNAPHHWLYDGHTYDTSDARALADDIVRDRYPTVHPPEPAHPQEPVDTNPDTNPHGHPTPKSPSSPSTEPTITPINGDNNGQNNPDIHHSEPWVDPIAFMDKKWEREVVPWFSNPWNALGVLALAGIVVIAYTHRRDKNPSRSLYDERNPYTGKHYRNDGILISRHSETSNHEARHYKTMSHRVNNVKRSLSNWMASVKNRRGKKDWKIPLLRRRPSTNTSGAPPSSDERPIA